MAANIITVCDALVTAVEAALDAPLDATVARLYLAPLDLSKDTGRYVWVFPARYSNTPASRGEDTWTHNVGVIVAERYTGAGEPTTVWIDERVEFCEAKVFTTLDLVRPWLSFGVDGARRLLTQTAEVTVYDDLRLAEKKLFWSEMRFEFTEILDA